jgi:hypothetical protein
MQDKSLIRPSFLHQGIDAADGFGKHISERSDAPGRARSQPSKKEVGLPAKDCKLILGEDRS